MSEPIRFFVQACVEASKLREAIHTKISESGISSSPTARLDLTDQIYKTVGDLPFDFDNFVLPFELRNRLTALMNSTTDITLSHADLPGVITEALRVATRGGLEGQLDGDGEIEESTLRVLAKDVSKALVLHARRNGG